MISMVALLAGFITAPLIGSPPDTSAQDMEASSEHTLHVSAAHALRSSRPDDATTRPPWTPPRSAERARARLEDLSIDFANLSFPPSISHVASATDSTTTVEGQLYIEGATNEQDNAVQGVRAQVGYGPVGTLPETDDWNWFEMRPSPGHDFSNDLDLYIGRMLPLRTGTFKFTTRWSTDGGATWTYTDQVGPPYDEADAGDITIVRQSDTVPPLPPSDLTVQNTSSREVTLGWTPAPNVDRDVAGYLVERKRASASTYARIAEVNDVSGASTDTYTDDTVSPGETYDYRILAYDVALNESTATNPVRATTERRRVDVTFRVTIPDETPGAFPVYLTGTFQDAPFTHGEAAWKLSELDATTWETTVSLTDGRSYEYRYTRGDEARVETEADGNTPLPKRTLTATYGANGTQLVEETVAGWRDPFVTSLSPSDGATGLVGASVTIDLTWNQAMPPGPAGFSLTGSTGDVRGTWTYDAETRTHTFTPDAPLPVDTYTIEQTDALDQNGDKQEVDVQSVFSVGVLPVELTRFDVVVDGGDVVLTWRTASESVNDRFVVQRSSPDAPAFSDVGTIQGAGTTDAAQGYRFIDASAPPVPQTLTYRLKQVDVDGSVHYGPRETVRRKPPARVRLQSISPNPVSTTSRVVYELPRSQSVRVAVYDILGRRVATPVDTRQPAGRHRHTLDVSKLTSGTYFVRLTTPNTTRSQPFRVVR